jgi:hypothetical protein
MTRVTVPADRSVESRLLLGSLLRQGRTRARVRAADAAAAISGSLSKISRLESGQVPARRHDVQTLIRLYGMPAGEHADLLRLADQAGGPIWWDEGTAGISSEQVRDDLLLESAAERIFAYDSQCVSGLLQTPAYLNALCAASNWPCRTALNIEAMRRRTQLMQAAEAPYVWAFFSVSVLNRAPGGSQAALREQVQYLIRLVESRRAQIQLLPDSSSAHMHAGGQFEILRFHPPNLADVILLEGLDGIRVVRDTRAGERYRQVIDILATSAYNPAESAEILSRAAGTASAPGR